MMSKTKKILIFSLSYYPHVGGAEVAVKEITDRIVGLEFHMITLRLDEKSQKEERFGNVNIYRVSGNKLFFPLMAFFKAVSLSWENDFAVTWSIMANRAGFAALFYKLTHSKTKFTLTIQEGDPLDYPKKRMGFLYPILSPLFKMIFTKADKVTAISNYLAQWAREMGSKDVLVVPNGVDVEKFQNQILKTKVGERRKQYGFLDTEKVVITTSRLVRKNGVDLLIKAMKFLPPEVKLLIVGTGPLLGDLQTISGNLQLGQRVVFAGFVPPELVGDYLRIADVFARPSRTEGQGASFIEAMAARLPVVAPAVGGIPDFLKDKETGLICQSEDSEDLARKINILLRDENIRERVVENALKLVKEKYDWNHIAIQMSQVF